MNAHERYLASRLREICFHEAGHYVIANLFGMRVDFVEIQVTPWQERPENEGAVTLVVPPGRGVYGHFFSNDPSAQNRVIWALVYLAGPMAYAHMAKRSLARAISMGGGPDYQSAMRLISGLRDERWLARRTGRLVAQHWPEIFEVAEMLIYLADRLPKDAKGRIRLRGVDLWATYACARGTYRRDLSPDAISRLCA